MKNVSMDTSLPTPTLSSFNLSRMAQTLAGSMSVPGCFASRDVMKSWNLCGSELK